LPHVYDHILRNLMWCSTSLFAIDLVRFIR